MSDANSRAVTKKSINQYVKRRGKWNHIKRSKEKTQKWKTHTHTHKAGRAVDREQFQTWCIWIQLWRVLTQPLHKVISSSGAKNKDCTETAWSTALVLPLPVLGLCVTSYSIPQFFHLLLFNRTNFLMHDSYNLYIIHITHTYIVHNKHSINVTCSCFLKESELTLLGLV